MLKDLFFYIYHDDLGYCWTFFAALLFILCLILLICYFIYLKKKGVKFNKKHLIFLIPILIGMYQIIPVSLDFYADTNWVSSFVSNGFNANKAAMEKIIKIEQNTIKTAIIPWQKGAYYCKLAFLYFENNEGKKAYEAYDMAYKYLKSYKYPCWGIAFLAYYNKKDFDTAIELAKYHKEVPMDNFISICYIMKGDIEKAELYVDKSIQEKETYSNMSTKAYILKTKGNIKESLEYYKKALKLCKREKDKISVQRKYENLVEYENERIDLFAKQRGIKQKIK